MPERMVREILLFALTYPELSTKYRESACTGGVFMDTHEWCRIYPLPVRYLEKRVHRWDVISARVWQEPKRDSRPESWRIDAESIRVVRRVGTGRGRPPDWEERRAMVLRPGRTFQSLEALKAQQSADGTSLGIIRPRAGAIVHLTRRTDAEHREWRDKLHLVVDQADLLPGALRPPELEYLPNRIKIRFACEGARCRGHDCVVLDWEICELARRKGWDAAQCKLESLLSADYDTQFFMGNFNGHRKSFGIVGLWYPKLARQGRLF